MKIDAQNYKKTLTRFMDKGFFLFISKKIITFAGISALFNYADCKKSFKQGNKPIRFNVLFKNCRINQDSYTESHKSTI